MEPQSLAFLKRIASTMGILLLWMMLNTTIGIAFNYAFFENALQWQNIFFYLFFVLNTIGTIFWLRTLWKGKMQFGPPPDQYD
jgi:hypothetical protein